MQDCKMPLLRRQQATISRQLIGLIGPGPNQVNRQGCSWPAQARPYGKLPDDLLVLAADAACSNALVLKPTCTQRVRRKTAPAAGQTVLTSLIGRVKSLGHWQRLPRPVPANGPALEVLQKLLPNNHTVHCSIQ